MTALNEVMLDDVITCPDDNDEARSPAISVAPVASLISFSYNFADAVRGSRESERFHDDRRRQLRERRRVCGGLIGDLLTRIDRTVPRRRRCSRPGGRLGAGPRQRVSSTSGLVSTVRSRCAASTRPTNLDGLFRVRGFLLVFSLKDVEMLVRDAGDVVVKVIPIN